MSNQMHADVVIVGAGMVGLTLAAAMAPSGMKIIVLEQRKGDPQGFSDWVRAQQSENFDPRVSALTCASQQILTAVGAWEKMASFRLSPYTDMDVWDGEGTGKIHFSAQDLHEQALGHIVENRVTLAGLLATVAELDNVQLVTGVELVKADLSASSLKTLELSDQRCIETSLLVAADGALSKTRQMAGLPMLEWDYGHHAIVTTVKTSVDHQQTAWQRFTDDGPLALLPLSSDDGNHYCSIVWSTSPGHAKALMTLSDEDFCQALGAAFEHVLGDILETDQRSVFPLRQRHAQHYVKSGFVVIGDAAHTIHPLAGQGVNLGLLDAAQLAETLMAAYARGEALGSLSVLRRYQRERHSENIQMAATMEGFKRLFASRNPVAVLARNMGMNWLDGLGAIKNHLVQEAMGLSGKGPALAQRSFKDS
ncbi:FAD-dependent monooxygenase [Neptuniibacter caesariensis]|uniref:2-octaprenyl-3-methyl-6-methoxy-1,4-benzoquinol hydroxylase n=1 Tax=Neptuniibacter caesariensis TaxID=207954 RepID=A0A7U8C412_NEPCE|nr:FAD-dependent monooxygenase [Neptuniibacter caesariensis]EAR61113.1 2-octaprenyl-3-methyl-6-methoxy-1,4-benzoquinol hydroxylase [Oceanospirillum sp. MED92] [Neptuniibacter caesariensis]